MPPAPGLTNNTLRQLVCVSVGGKNVRLKFSNEFSKTACTMKSVQIAVQKGKQKRYGRYMGQRSDLKKAFVCLKPGQEINFVEGGA